MKYRQRFAVAILPACALFAQAFADSRIALGPGALVIDARGYVRLDFGSHAPAWPATTKPMVRLIGEKRVLEPEAVTQEGDTLTARFAEGAVCQIEVRPGDGFAVFEVTKFDAPKDITSVEWCSVSVPPDAQILGALNAAISGPNTVSLSAADINVHAFTGSNGRQDSDRPGCSHQLLPIAESKSGAGAARFNATSDDAAYGWSFCGSEFSRPVDLSGLKAIRAWVRGDAQGEQLKIQLYDGMGGYRDTYIPISFEGWQPVTTEDQPLNTLRTGHVTSLNLYYNGLPASKTVSCDIDRIEAIVVRDGKEEAILLEDFEAGSSFFSPPVRSLNVETVAQHGLLPARFGVLLAPHEKFFDAMERFEKAAGIPSPHPDGVWNKRSPLTKRSYLFITALSEPQIGGVIAMGKRGGFDTILILQDSWTHSTGHFEVNDKAFPGGIETLQRSVRRLKDAGFRVGFHFLGPSIYLNDAYVTPVPDPRLVKWASAELADGINATSPALSTVAAPNGFPEADGGYMGDGTVVQIGNELIAYGSRSLKPPFGFDNCQRGALGTTAASHAQGDIIHHVKRSYGYFLFDMDTSLIDEVTTNFARVANACDIDMIYFDGSENLQGPHWYYNARLHKAFYDKLARKDILLQASSFSHYSWHLLARSASADGHDDLKFYLDERSGVFDTFRNEGMPLDVGWYYGYDPRATPDMFEYVLGATIGYDSSMSFQVSLDAARKHPFINDILDLIARYERLRISGRVPKEMRDRLRIDPALAGVKTPEERAKLTELRREYRLISEGGRDVFQRVVYTPWHDVAKGEPATESWKLNVTDGPATVGIQLNAVPGAWLSAGPSYEAAGALTLESFDNLALYASQATLPGVTQRFSPSDDTRVGARAAEYSAESSLGTNDGWSVVTKTFDPPLDLSWHKAIGFWLRGDGKRGAFKLQLTDGSKAADFYIANDYTGWRYQQLVRPSVDTMDYAAVRTLSFYYNGLPAKTVVTCGIDDVKALRDVDSASVVDPWIEIGGKKISWHGALGAGQYLFHWPGKPWRRYGAPLTEPESGTEIPEPLILSAGDQPIRSGCTSATIPAFRVRIVLEPPERYDVP